MTTPGIPSRYQRAAQGFTQLLTNTIKIAGLVSAIDQLLLKDHPTPLALGVSAFMIAGGQLSEGLILTLIDRLVGGGEHQAKTPKPPGAA